MFCTRYGRLLEHLGIARPGEFVVYLSQDKWNRGLYFNRITERYLRRK